MKEQNEKKYLTPTIKVVKFKVEMGLTVSPQGEPPIQGQGEAMNRKGWDVDWSTSTGTEE